MPSDREASRVDADRRKEFKPHLIRWDEVKPESVTGKQMIYFVPDRAGRPIVLMRPRWDCILSLRHCYTRSHCSQGAPALSVCVCQAWALGSSLWQGGTLASSQSKHN